MRKWRKVLVGGALAAAVLLPSGMAAAAGAGNGSPNPSATCTGDQQMLHLRDGTGGRHLMPTAASADDQVVHGYQHGVHDGTGPVGTQPLDGTGMQWGAR